VSGIKVGDKVKVLERATGEASHYVGQTLTVGTVHRSGSIHARAEDGTLLGLRRREYTHLPVFAPGDRVRVVAEGMVSTIECVWHSEAREDRYELKGASDILYAAEELEVAPEEKREPKAGEVWGIGAYGPCLIVRDETDTLAPIRLDSSLRIPSGFLSPISLKVNASHFLAASLKEAAEKGLL